jgi:hypothetical protein
MSHFPRRPVRFVEGNAELLKSMEPNIEGGQAGATDLKITEHASDAHMDPQFRAPTDRINGNEVFRRYPNGNLDLENAKHIVVDLLHKVKDKHPLTDLECLILGCFFPLMFPLADAGLAEPMMRVQLRIAPWECLIVTQLVADHLQSEMGYDGRFPVSHPRS